MNETTFKLECEKAFNHHSVLDHGFVQLIDFMGTDQRIVEAARVSYQQSSKGVEADTKLLHYLWKNRHTSPFEMCKITFHIKLPIFVMRQFVRHRMQNLNEVSARYSELPKEFYIPSVWREQDTKNKQGSNSPQEQHPLYSLAVQGLLSAGVRNHCEKTYELYQSLLQQGVARELARIVLPVNIYTEIYSCWDLNNLLKFFTLRDDPHAQWEHQQYAKAMKEITRILFPVTMEAYDKFKFELKEQ